MNEKEQKRLSVLTIASRMLEGTTINTPRQSKNVVEAAFHVSDLIEEELERRYDAK